MAIPIAITTAIMLLKSNVICTSALLSPLSVPSITATRRCVKRMRVVAKRRVRRPSEPYILMANRKPNDAAGPIREFRGENR